VSMPDPIARSLDDIARAPGLMATFHAGAQVVRGSRTKKTLTLFGADDEPIAR
jgi:hypothetical protein